MALSVSLAGTATKAATLPAKYLAAAGLTAASGESVFIAKSFAEDPWVQLTLAGLVLASALLCVPLARLSTRGSGERLGASRIIVSALFLLSMSGILALTVVPGGGWAELLHGSYGTRQSLAAVKMALDPRDNYGLQNWNQGVDGPLNVALYVPAGLFGALVFRRHRIALVVGLGLLSFVIECYQAYTGTRIGSIADVLSNFGGAALGVLTIVMIASPFGGEHTRAGGRAELGRQA
ncbi:VanZ family protein [Jatrophihabitans sp. DSM 45814]